jgi:hypothetical protein
MADRYWVGGSGTWSTTSTTNWSATPGGASGASAPTAADSVFFDRTGTYTVTLSSGLTCLDLTVTAGTVTFANGVSPSLTVSGSFTLLTGTVWSSSGTITFNATTTGKTITTNGVTMSAPVVFNGVGGGWTLGSAWTTSNLTFTITNGSFDTGNYNLTISQFNSNNSNVRTITLGSSTLSINSSLTIASTNLTFNADTSQINVNGATFAGGGLTFYNVSFTGTTAGTTRNITGANTFNNLSYTSPSSSGVIQVTFAAPQTINGTLTCAGATAVRRIFLRSDVIGTTRTLTVGTLSAQDCDFRDIEIAGAASGSSPTRAGNCGGNSNITFPAAKTVYWNLAGSQNWSATGWAASSGASPDINNFPLAQDTAIFESTSPGTGTTITIDASWNIGTINMSARTSNTMTLATSTNTPTIYGNWVNGTGTTLTGTGTMTFAGRGSQTITSAGKSFTQSLAISTPGGSVTLQDAFTSTRNDTSAFILTAGTFDANIYNVTFTGSSTQLNLSAGSTLTRSIALGSGTWTIPGENAGAWNAGSPTGFSVTGTGTIKMTGAAAKTFQGGGLAYTNITLDQGGAGALTISGNNTFKNITNSYSATGATTIIFPASTTQTVSSFTAGGAATKLLTLNSTSGSGIQATIAVSGGNTVSTDYLNVKDIAFTPAPATDGTTPYVWYLGANSTNSGNNTGGLFQAGGAGALKVYQITNTATTSWTVPSDWNSSSNTIYMIGAGGGGGTSAVSGNNRAAGGGGGGGGYTAVSNYSASPSASVTVAIGTSSANADGTNTTWASGTYTAGGGKKGTAATTPTSAGGAGGTGTYAGGAGGAGAFGTVASTGYGGGGGGGSAGFNGVGGAGGIGFGATTLANIAGGGGGGNGGGSAGGNASSALGGNGGNNASGVGGATGGSGSGAAGTLGGGGAGGANGNAGGLGGVGIDILNTIGGGGGRGGSSSSSAAGTNTSIYGGGGPGAGVSFAGTAGTGGAGAQGLIVIAYTPSAGVASNTNFFMMFN